VPDTGSRHLPVAAQNRRADMAAQRPIRYGRRAGVGAAAAALHDPPAPRVPPASHFARTRQVDTQHSRGAQAIKSQRAPLGEGAAADTLILGLSVEPGKAGLLRREAALPEQVTPPRFQSRSAGEAGYNPSLRREKELAASAANQQRYIPLWLQPPPDHSRPTD